MLSRAAGFDDQRRELAAFLAAGVQALRVLPDGEAAPRVMAVDDGRALVGGEGDLVVVPEL
jgi:hypothetical protein